MKAPFAGIVGQDELAAREITIKQLATGEPRRIAVGEAAETIASLLES